MMQESRRPLIRRLARLALLALGLALAWGIVYLGMVMVEVRQLRSELVLAESRLTPPPGEDFSLSEVRAHLAAAAAHTEVLRARVWPLRGMLRSIGSLPGWGDNLMVLYPTLEAADALIHTADQLLAAAEPLIEPASDGGSGTAEDTLPHILDTLETGQAQIDAAHADFVRAQQARAEIGDPTRLSPRLRAAVAEIDRMLLVTDQAFAMLEAAPAALGAEQPHHLLVLVQNADEVRPTGGFISSTVYLVVERGQITEMTVLNSDAPEIDRFSNFIYDPPPYPLYAYMGLPIWAFRDANWSPDFPTSATAAASLYTAGRNVPVDSVIAINQYTLPDYLRVLGEVRVQDGTVVTAANAVDTFRQLHKGWHEHGEPSRKAFIGEIATVLFERLLSVRSQSDYYRLSQATWETASRRDLLIYSEIPAVQAAVERLGWDGGVPLEAGDYLYVVDSNIGINKTDLNIRREIFYHVSLTRPDQPFASLTLQYRNESPGQNGRACPTGSREQDYYAVADDCYVDYLRLYLPDGAQPLDMPAFALPADFWLPLDPAAGRVAAEFDQRRKEVIGGLMIVEAGETVTADFAYTLPASTLLTANPDGTLSYHLLVQRQPGVPAYPLKVQIDLPPGAQVIDAVPQPAEQDERALLFDLTLAADVRIDLRLAGVSAEQMASAGLPESFTELTPTPRVLPTPLPLAVLQDDLEDLARPLIVIAERNVPVRAGPGPDYDWLRAYESGDTVAIYARDVSGVWGVVLNSDGEREWVRLSRVGADLQTDHLPVVLASGLILTPTPIGAPAP